MEWEKTLRQNTAGQKQSKSPTQRPNNPKNPNPLVLNLSQQQAIQFNYNQINQQQYNNYSGNNYVDAKNNNTTKSRSPENKLQSNNYKHSQTNKLQVGESNLLNYQNLEIKNVGNGYSLTNYNVINQLNPVNKHNEYQQKLQDCKTQRGQKLKKSNVPEIKLEKLIHIKHFEDHNKFKNFDDLASSIKENLQNLLLEGDYKEKERCFRLKYSIPKDIKIDENDIGLYYQISHIVNSENPADEIKDIAKKMLEGTENINGNNQQNSHHINKKFISEHRKDKKPLSIDNTSKAHNASAENLRNIMITQEDEGKQDNYTKLQQDKSYNLLLSPKITHKKESSPTNRTEDAITADSILAVVAKQN